MAPVDPLQCHNFSRQQQARNRQGQPSICVLYSRYLEDDSLLDEWENVTRQGKKEAEAIMPEGGLGSPCVIKVRARL